MKYIITESQSNKLAKYIEKKLEQEFVSKHDFICDINVTPIDPDDESEAYDAGLRFDVYIYFESNWFTKNSLADQSGWAIPSKIGRYKREIGSYITKYFSLGEDEIYITTTSKNC